MATSIVIHPSLVTRIVFLAVFVVLLTVATLLPFPRTQHIFLRLATTSLGAFGTILSISIFASIPAWADVWKRLWLDDDVIWGSSQERGLSAGFCLFQVFGALCDFFLHWKFGECPDKLWDQYLAKYTTNLPDRAGSFRPFTSVWDRLFGRTPPEDHPTQEKDIFFPPDTEPRIPASPSQKATTYQPSYDFSPAHLKKSRSNAKRIPGLRAQRQGVKFQPGINASSSDSEDELDTKVPPRRWSLTKSNSATTLIEENLDINKEYAKLNKSKEAFFIANGAPEYSDHEEDLASLSASRREKDSNSREDKPWTPVFLKKQASSNSSTAGSSSQATTAVEPNGLVPVPVPATPSLIKALDRVAVAQKDAFGHAAPHPGLPHTQSRTAGQDEGLPTTVRQPLPKSPEGPKWNEFWRDVENKVHETR